MLNVYLKAKTIHIKLKFLDDKKQDTINSNRFPLKQALAANDQNFKLTF